VAGEAGENAAAAGSSVHQDDIRRFTSLLGKMSLNGMGHGGGQRPLNGNARNAVVLKLSTCLPACAIRQQVRGGRSSLYYVA